MKTLLPFQEAAVLLLAERNFLLADDCGLGKTLMAVEAAKQYARGPILVVCPKPVKEWWAKEIREQKAGRACVTGTSGRGCPYTTLNALQNASNRLLWVIAHTESVRVCGAMRAVKWDWIIADEAHRFKNRKAKQTEALWKLKANRRIAMTATPYGRNPADMWALLRWLYPKGPPEVDHYYRRLFTSYWRFFNEFVEAYQPQGKRYHIVQGPKRLRDLAALIAPFYRRVTKDEANLGLPPITYSDVPVLIDGRQGELYRTLIRDSYADLAGHEVILENALLKILRLHQCALDPNLLVTDGDKMFVLGQIPAKIGWLIHWLADNPYEPVVIVSRYRRFVEEWLRELAPDSCIVGGMSAKDVTKAVEEFGKPRAEGGGILVGSLASVCEGLNLQHASTMVITDGTWSPAQSYQLTQRIHRIGQDRPCQVIHLVGLLTKGRKRRTVDYLVRRAQMKRMSEQQLVDDFVRGRYEMPDLWSQNGSQGQVRVG